MDKRLSYDEYNKNGKTNGRKLHEPSPFKRKIYALIDNERKNDKVLHRIMKIMFYMCHIESHKDFLMDKIEEDDNYYRTYNNIDKCKIRCAVEILDCKRDELDLKLNKMGKKDSRMWKVVMTIRRDELTIITTVPFSKVKEYLPYFINEETEIEHDVVMFGDRYMNKQQYFEHSLRDSFNIIDSMIFNLIKMKTELNKKNNK